MNKQDDDDVQFKRIILIKSANDADRGKYLRINPYNLQQIDANGDKGKYSRWELRILPVIGDEDIDDYTGLGDGATLRNVMTGQYLEVIANEEIGDYRLGLCDAMTGTNDEGCYFDIELQYKVTVAAFKTRYFKLESMLAKGQCIEIDADYGHVGLGKYGIKSALALFEFVD